MLKKLSCFYWHAKLHRLGKKEPLSLLVKWPSSETVFSNEFLRQNKLPLQPTLMSPFSRHALFIHWSWGGLCQVQALFLSVEL